MQYSDLDRCLHILFRPLDAVRALHHPRDELVSVIFDVLELVFAYVVITDIILATDPPYRAINFEAIILSFR